MLIRLSWRNVLRNKRRSILTGIAIGVGIGSMIVGDALFEGMMAQMVRQATGTFIGHAQVHAKEFMDTFASEKNLDPGPVMEKLKADPGVSAVTQRAQIIAMITSASNASGISLFGVNPETERDLSQVHLHMKKGEFLKSMNDPGILLGDELADLLEVGLGDRVVITASQASSGDMVQNLYRVSGIFRMNFSEMDGGMAFVSLSGLQKLIGIGSNVHEIAVKYSDPGQDRMITRRLRDSLEEADGIELKSWRELFPAIQASMDMVGVSIAVMITILFSVVALGILNTLFMSLYERMIEFGILRAIGTRPGMLVKMVLTESAFLALISVAIGVAMGGILTVILMYVGIDYGNIEYAGVAIQDAIYPIPMLRQYTIYPLSTFVFTVIIALYPAGHAARIKPAVAMRNVQ